MTQDDARQHCFNIMVNHLRKQKCQSRSGNGDICSYRGSRGRRCAIGPLIVTYDSKFEGTRPIDPSIILEPNSSEKRGVELFKSLIPEAQESGQDFLYSAQIDLHDGWTLSEGEFSGWFEKQVKQFARDYNLTIPEKV